MAVGPNEMVDLEFLQSRTNERSAPCAPGIGFLERGERAEFCALAAITTHNVPLITAIRSFQRLQLAEHGWDQFGDSRMNVHGALNYRVRRVGVHHVED